MAFTNVGSEQDVWSGVSDFTYTANVTVPSLGTNSIGVVMVASAAAGASASYITGITWNGVAMSEAVDSRHSTHRSAHVWYLADPPDGAAYDIVVTFDTNYARALQVTVMWADSGGTVTLDDTSAANGTTQNPTITSTQAGADELVVSVSAHAANAITGVTNCTELQRYDSGANGSISAYSIPTGSGDVTHQHDYSQSEVYAIASASFKEESAAAAASLLIPRRKNTLIRM